MAPITVLTATMPGREEFLTECMRSVSNQTVKVEAHLIRSKVPEMGRPNPLGLAEQRNALLQGVQTEWLSILDDDDYWYSHHVETIESGFYSGADIIYTWGDGLQHLREIDVTTSYYEAREILKSHSPIPSASAIRTSLAREIGGWGGPFHDRRFVATGATWDDWDFWARAVAMAGAKFLCIPEVTWYHREHPNKAGTLWG